MSVLYPISLYETERKRIFIRSHPAVSGTCLYRLYLGVQSSNMIAGATMPVDREKLDAVRADYIREQLPELKEV